MNFMFYPFSGFEGPLVFHEEQPLEFVAVRLILHIVVAISLAASLLVGLFNYRRQKVDKARLAKLC